MTSTWPPRFDDPFADDPVVARGASLHHLMRTRNLAGWAVVIAAVSFAAGEAALLWDVVDPWIGVGFGFMGASSLLALRAWRHARKAERWLRIASMPVVPAAVEPAGGELVEGG